MKSNVFLAGIILFALGIVDTLGVMEISSELKINAVKLASDSLTTTHAVFVSLDRPIQEVIPPPKESITVGEIEFRIVKVAFDKTAMGFVPPKMSEDQQVMFVEIELLSGFKENFKDLDITVSSGFGQKKEAIILASGSIIQILSDVILKGSFSDYQPEKDNIAWAFVVPKSMDELYLNFPTGEIIDLKPFIK